MNKYIVTTTINSPTIAIKKFAQMKDWKLIVVGDKKTPPYNLKSAIYLTPEDQEKYDKKLSDTIGWNCIQRRNFGLLKAHELGADIIAIIDDDNIPLNNWGKNLFLNKETEVNFYKTNLEAFDPIGATNTPHLWHRGFPLQLISKRKYNKTRKIITPSIQADFWNGDPDIDAICRLEHAPDCKFQNKYFPIASNALSPFNSQNTFITKEVLRDYFLFPHIGRMDDIWASYFVQGLGHKVVYGKPSVYQARNEHNLINDMKAEYIGYELNFKIVNDIKKDPYNLFKYLPKKSIRAFELYKKHFD